MLSFGWLLRLFSRKKSCKYITSSSCCIPTPTPTAYCIEKSDIYKSCNSTLNNTCCCNNNCGYRQSPYSKTYKKPGSCNHEYKPISTTFFNNTCCTTPTPTSSYNYPTPTPETTSSNCVNFYETQQMVCCGVAPTPAPTFTQTCVQTVESEIENAQPATDYVLPKEGHIFVMNGYGVNLDVNGVNVIGFIDMGVDVNILPGQRVLLLHPNGPYDGKIGVIVSETNTERNTSINEILIQKILNV